MKLTKLHGHTYQQYDREAKDHSGHVFYAAILAASKLSTKLLK